MTDADHLVLHRNLAASRAAAYDAFTRPGDLARWWGPEGFTCTVHRLDARPGGEIRLDMHDPRGNTYPMTGTYEALEPPERVVFLARAVGPDGTVELESRDVVTFADDGTGTVVRVDVRVLRLTETGAMYREGMAEGWTQSLDCLARALDGSAPPND